MVIKYVEGEVTVFEVNGCLYYFRDAANYPELYDGQLHKMIVPNMDHWLQAATQQRHSLQGLRDMAAAFVSGLQCGVSDDDARVLISISADAAKRMLLQTDLTTSYARAYFIELLDPAKIEPVCTRSISENFDVLLKKCGHAKLYNYLCRFWQACNYILPSAAAVFEAFIRRLGRQPASPEYPKTDELDNQLQQRVHQAVLKRMTVFHVPDEMIINVRRIQSKRI